MYFPDVKFPLSMTDNLPGGQLPLVLWRWLIGLLYQKKKKKKRVYFHVCRILDQNPSTRSCLMYALLYKQLGHVPFVPLEPCVPRIVTIVHS